MSSSTTTKKGETNDEENVTVEEIEQTCNRLSKYDPCFRLSFIQQEMKKFGISTNDERLVKMMSLSFETMIRQILADCARTNRERLTPTKTLTVELWRKTLLNEETEEIPEETIKAEPLEMETNDFDLLFDS